ncbi:hypothetical protein [Paenibacillus sp. UNC499MF]|uniref:hypothetical protein n=1 Tax=Paenibacillus sp. UNC499MF TaxID=1502751 RepID=UPI0008A04DA7|nr:hypothetical protein [Paenibacillus sp. UNC499MF]SEG56770.1 hypothetical protein SAMN02799616_03560 [Paenibacillus sp. UNC499MF]
MKQKNAFIRWCLFLMLSLLLGFSAPVPLTQEAAAAQASSTYESVPPLGEHKSKYVIRKAVTHHFAKMVKAAITLVVLSVLCLFTLFKVPLPGLPYKPFVCLLRRKQLLLPIKFTSNYVV